MWTDISNAVPTQHGTYRNAPGFNGSGAAGTGTSVSAWQGSLPSGAFTNVTGVNNGGGGSTVGKLYTWSGTTFTDRSIAGDYTDNAAYWSFAQFGIYTLATNGLNQIQVRDATGAAAFANLAGTPPTTAKILVLQSNAVLAFNINTGGQYWAASDVGNHANWTTGEAVTATPINHRPGAITAAAALRDEVIVFKEDSCYRMRYVGSEVFWMVDLISDRHGAIGPGSLAVCGDSIKVLDYKNGAYSFDGSSFRRLDDGIKSFLIAASIAPVAAQYFRNQETIYWNTPTAAFLAYNIQADAWGKFTAETPDSEATTPNHVLMTGSGIYDCMRGVTMINFSNADPVLLSFAEDEIAGTSNTALNGYVTSGYFGSPGFMTLITRVTPQLKVPDSIIGTTNVPAASALAMTPYSATNPEGTPVAGAAVACSTDAEKRFDLLKSAQWQKFKFTFTNTPWEIDDLLTNGSQSGVSP